MVENERDPCRAVRVSYERERRTLPRHYHVPAALMHTFTASTPALYRIASLPSSPARSARSVVYGRAQGQVPKSVPPPCCNHHGQLEQAQPADV